MLNPNVYKKVWHKRQARRLWTKKGRAHLRNVPKLQKRQLHPKRLNVRRPLHLPKQVQPPHLPRPVWLKRQQTVPLLNQLAQLSPLAVLSWLPKKEVLQVQQQPQPVVPAELLYRRRKPRKRRRLVAAWNKLPRKVKKPLPKLPREKLVAGVKVARTKPKPSQRHRVREVPPPVKKLLAQKVRRHLYLREPRQRLNWPQRLRASVLPKVTVQV